VELTGIYSIETCEHLRSVFADAKSRPCISCHEAALSCRSARSLHIAAARHSITYILNRPYIYPPLSPPGTPRRHCSNVDLTSS
jgi:hypothetical protein